MIVITGGAGFIGWNLYQSLKDTHSILLVDFEDAFKENGREGCTVMDPLMFLAELGREDFASKIDVILHNGACSDTTVTDPFHMMTVNFDYSVSLLKYCIMHQIRLIYASSASVYGDGPFEEHATSDPKNMYALSKSMFDEYARCFQPFLPQLAGLRYFNVYGNYEDHKDNMSSVAYKFFNQSKSDDKTIKLFEGSDNFLRDFIHVDDVVAINKKFLENQNLGGIYNVGTGTERSFTDIAKIVSKRYNSKIEYIDMPEKLRGKSQKYTKSDNTRLSSMIDHKFLTLEEGVAKYLDFLENR